MAESEHKSEHLKGLEAAFEKRTRRFSPFEILGLDSAGGDDPEGGPAPDSLPESDALAKDTPDTTPPPMGGYSTPMGGYEISTPGYDTPTHGRTTSIHGEAPPTHGCSTPTRVVERSKILRTLENTTTQVDSIHPPEGGVDTPIGGYEISTPGYNTPHSEQAELSLPTGHQVQDVADAMVLRGQLAEKARRVLGCLNDMRSLEQPSYTMPLGYARLSDAAGLSDRHLRREVLPKLAMLGLVAVAHRSFQGTVYLLQHDAGFLRLVAASDDEIEVGMPVPVSPSDATLSVPLGEVAHDLPVWIDRELWGPLPPETIQQLIAKAGSEAQAQEKLEIIVYNETHGPEERRVRDRRSVLSHYLRSPQADVWPNNDGYETLALRHARETRDRALAEKALAEEALQAQQETARLRFLANLEETQMAWLKREAKQRVDERPEAKFLESRYPLYKAEEETLMLEWMDRVTYGEVVPHVSQGK